MYKILIVEDDTAIAGALARQMERWGWEARLADDFARVDETFEAYGPDLVILDLKLPLYDGCHWCAELRRRSRVPILMLTSAGDDQNLIMAVNLGADDFLAKPVRMEVLTARIRALLRRSYDFGAGATSLSRGGLTLHLGDGLAEYAGQRCSLTKNEAILLRLLLENPGRTVRRSELIRALWDREDFIDDNTLTVNMGRLRRKLEAIGAGGRIVTRKGEGYLLQEDGPC